MKTILDSAHEASIRSRVGSLRPDAPAQWGRMSVSQMLCHLIDAFRVPLGDTEAAFKGGILTSYPVRWLLIYQLPWPKGKIPTAPEYLQTQPTSWEGDVKTWSDCLDRFLARARHDDAGWGTHPAFGDLSTREWGRLTYLHSDHHLRQFGA